MASKQGLRICGERGNTMALELRCLDSLAAWCLGQPIDAELRADAEAVVQSISDINALLRISGQLARIEQLVDSTGAWRERYDAARARLVGLERRDIRALDALLDAPLEVAPIDLI